MCDKPFYEVEVNITHTRVSSVAVHLRASSADEAQQLAVLAARSLCDKAISVYDLHLDHGDFSDDTFEAEDVESIKLIGHGEKPYWEKPNIDLRDSTTDDDTEVRQPDDRQGVLLLLD